MTRARSSAAAPTASDLIARHRRMADGSLLLTVSDVTDIRRAEAALRASEQRYALVTEAATEGFYEWDIANDALFVSPQLNRMFAFEFQRPGVLSSGTSASCREDYAHYRDALRDYFMQRTDRFQCEYRIRVGSGEVRWLTVASAVRRPEAGPSAWSAPSATSPPRRRGNVRSPPARRAMPRRSKPSTNRSTTGTWSTTRCSSRRASSSCSARPMTSSGRRKTGVRWFIPTTWRATTPRTSNTSRARRRGWQRVALATATAPGAGRDRSAWRSATRPARRPADRLDQRHHGGKGPGGGAEGERGALCPCAGGDRRGPLRLGHRERRGPLFAWRPPPDPGARSRAAHATGLDRPPPSRRLPAFQERMRQHCAAQRPGSNAKYAITPATEAALGTSARIAVRDETGRAVRLVGRPATSPTTSAWPRNWPRPKLA